MKKLVFLCMCVANCITASAQSYEAMFGQNRPVNAYPVATWDVDGQIKSGVNGEIVLTFEGDFSEAQRGCAQKAADIWAQHVALKGNMELLLKKADLGATLPSKTDVSYVYVSAGKCVPSSYDKGMNSSKRIFGADAIITYNLNVDWNCDFPGSEAKSKSDFI